ncbi:flagellin [Halalkalibacterium halodurans]|uniref:flagellin N-terminal helical domain-containing protein n=1 Tax=Halalkalibacterium halodurans TaxID=86665 RepID=UPI002E1DCF81|nr:flagellin [Halalkalibacterium halodurans]MED3645769.1 flagellin [Halalkalibacterium halodurans]
MIINHNLPAMNAHRNMGINLNQGQKAMEKLSSGLRINRAGDDAAGLAISEKMRAQIRGLDQASRNAQDGISLIQTAEGAMNESHAILQRMRELAVQAANDTNDDANDRAALQLEIGQLIDELDRINTDTKFNNKEMFGESFTLHIGPDTDSEKLVVAIAAIDSATLGVDEVNISTDASGAIDTINNAINTLSTSRAQLGAWQNRLEHTIKNLDNASENLQAAESRIRDVDMAKEMMEFTRTNILNQASQAMLAQANQQPQAVLQLLR